MCVWCYRTLYLLSLASLYTPNPKLWPRATAAALNEIISELHQLQGFGFKVEGFAFRIAQGPCKGFAMATRVRA